MPRFTTLWFFVVFLSFALILTLRAFGTVAFGAERCDGAGQPTTTVYMPNVTKTLGGPAGWVTPIYVQNSGVIQTVVELSFYRFRDGALIACHKTPLVAPGASLVDNPNEDADLPDDTQFSVVAKSFGAPIVAVVNQVQGSGVSQQALAYSGFSQGDLTVYVPNVTRRFFGYDVPLIVQNVGQALARVTARFISFDGASTYTRTFTITPGRSGVIDPDFEPASTGAPNSGLVDGTQYAVTLASDQPIAVVANAHNEAGAPVAFSHNGIARGATTLYAPYAAKAVPPGDTFSPIVVQNLGTAPTDAQLLFVSSSGAVAPQTFTLRGIPAGSARAFDPRFALGTTTPCAVASAICLGPGEYSLKITSPNPVAAVVLPNSATTASAYLASAALSARSLIPTAFRRIGGPSGWSTRMLVYAGAPAQLTVRAFAIPSGDLAARFAVTVGTTGWATFDLNPVAGLPDDAQYSVTIDGGGVPITAVAMERASTGGDALMLFEGFDASALPTVLAPASAPVTPSTKAIPVAWTQQFSASARDQFGATLPEQLVTWSVAPAALGTISPSGAFTASAIPGVGTIAATAGAVTTSVPVSTFAPPTVTQGGLTFWSFAGEGADVMTETSIGAAASQAVVVQVDADIAQIQRDYARQFGRRPVVYANGSATTFFQAVRLIGGATSTPSWASGLCICHEPHPDWVFVDWRAEEAGGQKTTVRHELTHVMQHQIVPAAIVLPAFFDEGNARVEEFTLANTQWWAAVQRYRSASMSANNATFTLFELISQAEWSARSADDAAYQYALAAQAVEFLRADIGMAGELLMFDLMRQGRSFFDAYDLAAGRSYLDFQAEFTTRVRALATRYPGIAAAPDSPEGPGLTFLVYGVTPNTTVSYTISGSAGQTTTNTRTADKYGFFYTYLSTGWRPGQYTMTFSWSGATVTGSGVKMQ